MPKETQIKSIFCDFCKTSRRDTFCILPKMALNLCFPKLSLSKLETFLKSQCDALRGSMDASEYKDYLIAMIFLKRVNDQFAVEQEKFKKDLKKEHPNLTEDDILEEIELQIYKDKYEFFVPPSCSLEDGYTS